MQIVGLTYYRTDDGNLIPNGNYYPDPTMMPPVLDCLSDWDDEVVAFSYLKEVALAISALPEEYIERASSQDATYLDPSIDFGNVIDFAEWRIKNYSANAANALSSIEGRSVENAEKLNFYVNHLYSRIEHGR